MTPLSLRHTVSAKIIILILRLYDNNPSKLFDRAPPDAIDLATGGPSADILPGQLFANSSQLAFATSQSWAGKYKDELQSDTILQVIYR